MTAPLLTEMHRLECLLHGPQRLQQSEFIVVDGPVDAPMLRKRKMSARMAPCLKRAVYARPTLPGGGPILTSEIHVSPEQDGKLYARALNRWYPLQTAIGPRYRA